MFFGIFVLFLLAFAFLKWPPRVVPECRLVFMRVGRLGWEKRGLAKLGSVMGCSIVGREFNVHESTSIKQSAFK